MGHFLRLGRPPRLKFSGHALWTSIWLSVLFLVVYSSSNWLTTLRSDVGTWAYDWEVWIPFVPAMIIPYMSIDLFFVVAPFILVDQRARVVFGRRIALTILIAALCYLMFPLVLVMDRPRVEGWLGLIFNPFVSMDKPHNLLPSLHIALGVLLAECYLRRSTGWWRIGLAGWFTLICLSTLLTWQHQVVDLAGGVLLALVVLHCVQRQPLKLPVEPNPRIGAYYGLGAALLLVWGWWLQPLGAVLLWPAGSLLLLAMANLWLGPGVFRKRQGRLPWLTRVTLWPVLWGQRASLWWYAREGDVWNEVDHHVWVGRLLSDAQARQAIAQGVVATIDLTGEFSEARPLLDLPYLNLPVMDLTCPNADQLERAMAFIEEHQPRGVVYVHCKIGYSRSASVAGAWLLRKDPTLDVAGVVRQLKSARPTIRIRPEIRRLFERLVQANASVRRNPSPGAPATAVRCLATPT